MKSCLCFIVIMIVTGTTIYAQKEGVLMASSHPLEGTMKSNQIFNGNYYTFYRSTMCKAVQDKFPYNPINETTFFSANDSTAIAWIHLTYLYKPVRLKWIWTMIDFQTVYTEIVGDWSSDPQDFGYDYWIWWKIWGWIYIDGYPPADSSNWGAWKVDVFIEENYSGNWNHDTTMYFEISSDSLSAVEEYNRHFQEPRDFQLLQNYPNPFNAETKIDYKITRSSKVTIKIYNMLGEEVAILVDEKREPGVYTYIWNSKDENGENLASGIYIYRIQTNKFSQTRKMALIR